MEGRIIWRSLCMFEAVQGNSGEGRREREKEREKVGRRERGKEVERGETKTNLCILF